MFACHFVCFYPLAGVQIKLLRSSDQSNHSCNCVRVCVCACVPMCTHTEIPVFSCQLEVFQQASCSPCLKYQEEDSLLPGILSRCHPREGSILEGLHLTGRPIITHPLPQAALTRALRRLQRGSAVPANGEQVISFAAITGG